MIDTHAHFNSNDIPDLKGAIDKANCSKLSAIINVGLDLDTSIEAVTICEENDKFYASIGIHPLHDGDVKNIFYLHQASQMKDKIVAIGETGLDIAGDLNLQAKRFIEQIQIANFFKLPVIVHSRKTMEETIAILENHWPEYGCVFHCVEPDLYAIKRIIRMGGYISVAKPITSPNASKSLQVIEQADINRLLIELDYPYMSDNPTVDGRDVFRKIMAIRNLNKMELEYILDRNAKRLFKRLNNKTSH